MPMIRILLLIALLLGAAPVQALEITFRPDAEVEAVAVTLADIARAAALKAALANRGVGADTLDAIIACTVTPDMMFPCTAALIQDKVGASKAYGFDLNAACSSFLFGLSTAAAMVASGAVQRVAVVGCDVMTSIMNPKDRNTVVLFGDGAGAVIVERVEEGYGILDF